MDLRLVQGSDLRVLVLTDRFLRTSRGGRRWRGAVYADCEDVVESEAVQIVRGYHRGLRYFEHVGSAHDEAELELLKAAARQRRAAGQGELDLGLGTAAPGGPLPVRSSRMGCLPDASWHALRVLGCEQAAGGDEVFGCLVLARVIESVSKLDSMRVLEEAEPTCRTPR